MRRKSKPGMKFALALAAFSLFAADSWQSKPYTEWNDKDVQKILSSSPWVHSVTISGDSARSYGDLSAINQVNHPAGMPSATGPGSGQGRDRMGDGDIAGPETHITFTVLWQSAMPVKQALVRRRFGAEAVGSVDAKKFLDETPGYVIAVSGPISEKDRAPQAKAEILQRTTLSVKGKDSVRATDMVVNPSGKVTEAVFVFPKGTPFTLEDKEVEFSTQFGPVTVKNKFHLKDMVVNGTLQL